MTNDDSMISKEAILGILVGIVVYSVITKYSDIFNRNSTRYNTRGDQEVHHDDTCNITITTNLIFNLKLYSIGVYMQQKYNIKTIEAFYELKIDIQERFFKHGISILLLLLLI